MRTVAASFNYEQLVQSTSKSKQRDIMAAVKWRYDTSGLDLVVHSGLDTRCYRLNTGCYRLKCLQACRDAETLLEAHPGGSTA